MGHFLRRDDDLVLTLDEYEVDLLPTLLAELTDLVSDPTSDEAADESRDEPGSADHDDDPFARWEQGFSHEPSLDDPDFLEPDPITRRLFPDAYTDDPAASHDFRRFTDAEQRAAKLGGIRTVMDDLEKITPAGRVAIPTAHLQQWMTTLNNLRLVLSVVLGITDETSADEAAQLPDSDPRSVIHHYYEWLGWMLESLMSVVAPDR